MHIVTRVGIAIGALMVLGAGLRAAVPETPAVRTPPAQQPGRPSGNLATTVPVTLPERLTQRKGEWSPTCARTKQPLIDFSPIDHGQSRNRVLLTVHNCSPDPVTLRLPRLELTKQEWLTVDGRPPKPIRLKPWGSAMTVLSWDPTRPDPRGPVPAFGVRVAGIGEGQLTDDLGLGMTRITFSQWTT